MGLQEEENSEEHWEFYPLQWLVSGYTLTGLNEESMEYLETRKKEYMIDHGYMVDGHDGYDAAIERTSRLVVEDGQSGTYKCSKVECVLLMSELLLTISLYIY